MPVTRRRLLQAMAAAGLLRGWPAFSADSLTFSVGTLPAPQHIHRIISAGAPADLLLMAAAPEKLLGFSSFDFAQTGKDLLPEAITRLPKLGRLAGRATTLSLEKLLALKPDLIVDCGNADDTWTSQAQRINAQTQIPWLLINGTLARTPQQLQAIGNALGVTFRTEPQAELARQFIEDAQSFAGADSAKVRFYAARGASGLETGLAGSLHTEAAELLGLKNVAQLPERQGLAQVSLENLLVWQPDIILVQEAATLHTLMHDPVWQGVNAVAQKRILFLSGLPFGWLDAPPGLNRLLGLRRLHAWLDQNVARTFEADMMRFSALFWHTALREDQFNRIVNAQ